MNALQAHELQELQKDQERERFEIENIEQANWAVRKIAAARAAIREREELAKAEIERIQQWLTEETEKLRADIEFFESLLHEYHQKVLAEDSKRKTIKLPYGVLKMRAQQPKLERDNEKLVAWLESRGTTGKAFIKVIKSPRWADLKKVLKVVGDKMIDPETGEVVPGVTVIEQPPKFSVEVE